MNGLDASFGLALIGLAVALVFGLPCIVEGNDRGAKIAGCVGTAFALPLILRLLVAAVLS